MLFTTRAVGRILLCALGALLVATAQAADFPAPKQGDWIARDFKFHTGEVRARAASSTTRRWAQPTGEPVLVLHGTTGSGAGMLTPAFARRAVRRRAAARRDAATSSSCPTRSAMGKSAKPSDGLRAKFPRYNYDDMVQAPRIACSPRACGIKRLRLDHRQLDGRHAELDLGREVPGLHGRRWCRWHRCPPRWRAATGCMRRLIIDSIRNDPEWKDGNYTVQPKARSSRRRLLRHRHQRRQPGLPQGGADARTADKLLDAAARGAVPRRCQRHALPVGLVARLQPVAGPRAHRGHAARDQRRRRRAQPA